MAKPRILYIVHNHPELHPGGAEAYALELYRSLRDGDRFEPQLVARIGPNQARTAEPHPGTPFRATGADPNELLVYTATERFDFFWMTHRDKSFYTRDFDTFLRAQQPDIVHFQHTLFLGYDLVTQVRRSLPDTPILYTLHEFLPICHRNGQMVRTFNGERCMDASPRRCQECFPEIPARDFFMRRRFIQSHLEHVDLFLAPSRFLRDRYIDWGIDPARIRFEEYGRRPAQPAPAGAERERTRIGFFGQLNPFKGVTVLLEAMRLLSEDVPGAHLWLHGANLELQTPAFQERFGDLLDRAAPSATLAGSYGHDALPGLMAGIDWVVVPSVWWENSPLVIQEAFQHGRPVICSDIGGMAEKVTHEVNGLHFRAGDPRSLAETLRRATTEPGLWDRLRAGIPEVYDMEDHVRSLGEIYDGLLNPTLRREAVS